MVLFMSRFFPSSEVDFLIIGAQKSGTTSLFKYLTRHPQIYMPPEKEVEFFHEDKKFAKGKEWYFQNYFGKANASMVKGEASTHYMMYSCVPERIHSVAPHAKLIALLRNPIDRAYSHYRMAVRRGVEGRSFEDSIVEDIDRVKMSDKDVDHNHDYVFFGEYGRILRNYLNRFDKSQIKVVFTEDMLRQPTHVIQTIYRFLDVNDSFVPSNIGKKYHISGQQLRPGLTKWIQKRVRWLKRQKWSNRFIWRIDFDTFFFWMETQFNVRRTHDPGPSNKARSLLLNHYTNDVALLENLIQTEVPWKEFKSKKL